MTVAYVGTGFHGFAAQAGVPTVGGALAEALATVLRQPVELTCAGRTDLGVHAWGQVVSFDGPEGLDPAELQRRVNKLLAPAVVVRETAIGPDGFDARRWATGRRYRYTVVNRPVPDPFLASFAWHVEEPLELKSMQLGVDPLIGEHDFTSFCRRPPADRDGRVPSMTRTVREAGWTSLGDGVLRFDIEASAFCHQMVRSVVGMLVAVGSGRRRAGEVAGILRAKDRSLAGHLAPPHGLCLWEVTYGDGPLRSGRVLADEHTVGRTA